MMYYEWCGLRLSSAFELPLARTADDQVDVSIVRGVVPDQLADPLAVFPLYQARPGTLRLDIPNVARFLVEDGARITVQQYPEADADDVWTFLLGSALGAICHQRGLLTLHASSVRVGDGCVAFSGASGAGKSTIAAFLSSRGYPLVADDQSVISLADHGTPVVRAGPARVKLWKDGVDQFRADTAGLSRVRGRLDKYHMPIETDGFSAALPLRRLYLLADAPTPRIQLLTGFEALEAVRQAVYRKHFVEPLGQLQTCFRLCAAVASSAQVALLSRPRGFDYLPGLLVELEREWSRKTA